MGDGGRGRLRKLGDALGSRRGVLALTAVGLLIRTFLAVMTQRFQSPELAYIQADSYMRAATYLRQFGHIPDPLYVPAYIALCAFLQRVFAGHALGVLIGLQVVLDTACIPLMYGLTKTMFGVRVAGWAALLVTFDSLLIVQPGLVLTEALYIPVLLVAILLFLYGTLRPRVDGPAALLYVAAGVFAGLGALTRSVGLVIPVVFTLILLILGHRRWGYKVLAAGLVWVSFLAMVLPVCRGNAVRYGHFSLSTSREFNMAVLMVGPAKKRTMSDVGPNLMDMWAAELGPGYREEPPYVLADRASAIAVNWAKGHPGLVLKTVVEGQAEGFVAPNRRSWAAALVWAHLSERELKVFDVVVAASRLAIAVLALAGVLLWRRLRAVSAMPGVYVAFMVLLVLGHIAGAGAVVMGRYFCPVAPYMDVLAAGALAVWFGMRGAGVRVEGRNAVVGEV